MAGHVDEPDAIAESRCAKPRSIVMPRAFSSGSRSASMPVSALTQRGLPVVDVPGGADDQTTRHAFNLPHDLVADATGAIASSAMPILRTLETDLKEALKAGNKPKVSTLRLLLAGLKNERIAVQRELTDEEVESVIRHGVKQRKDSIDQYGKGGRADLVAAEQAELVILEGYLPKELSESELKEAIRGIIAEKALASKKDIGIVMKELMRIYRGRADGRRAQQIASELLP